MYFEWAANVSTPDEKKLKYAFRPEGESQSLFWMAAIYRQTDAATFPVFTILTMDASESVAPIHNRMPVILRSKEARRAWMSGEKDLPISVSVQVKGCRAPESELVSSAYSKKVNGFIGTYPEKCVFLDDKKAFSPPLLLEGEDDFEIKNLNFFSNRC